MKQKHDYVIFETDNNGLLYIIATSNTHDNAVKIMNHFADYEAWNYRTKIVNKSFLRVELENGVAIRIEDVTRRSNPTSIKDFKETWKKGEE